MRSWILIAVIVLGVVLCACTTEEPNEMMDAPINLVAASNAQTLPCDVAAIVEQHCVRCHGTVLRGGATIPLVLAQDFAKPQGARTVAQAMVERITPGAGQPMPPPPALALSQPEIAALTAWTQNGSARAASSAR